MRWLLSFLLLGLLSIVHAISSSGNRLLVVLDDLAEKAKYSKYIADLEGMRIALAQLALRFLDRADICDYRERIFYHIRITKKR
jgi:oligosaccharyltransferase complex subunit beta